MKYNYLIPRVIIIFILFSFISVQAAPPEISGNYEQGQRYTAPNEEYFWDTYIGEYDENEEDTMYFFKKGSFQLKQDFFKTFGYSVRYQQNYQDFQKDNSDNDRKYLIASVKAEPYNKLNLKAGFYYREQKYLYTVGNQNNNVINAPFIEARYSPIDELKFILTYRHKIQDYSDILDESKNKKIDFFIIGAETKLYGVIMNFRYKIDYRSYSRNSSLNNTMKDSFSVGFRYKFK